MTGPLAGAITVALAAVTVGGLVVRLLHRLARFDGQDAERMVELHARLRRVVERLVVPAPFSFRPALAPLMLWLERGLGATLVPSTCAARLSRNIAALARALAATRRLLLTRRAYARFRGDLLRLTWLRFRERCHRVLGRTLRVWRIWPIWRDGRNATALRGNFTTEATRDVAGSESDDRSSIP